MRTPFAEFLDGHIVLSRDLAARNHYPAVDVLSSVSRLMPDVTSAEHRNSAGQLRDVLATYRSSEDLINIGAYARGSNSRIDFAINKIDAVNSFLTQRVEERAPFSETVTAIKRLFSDEKV